MTTARVLSIGFVLVATACARNAPPSPSSAGAAGVSVPVYSDSTRFRTDAQGIVNAFAAAVAAARGAPLADAPTVTIANRLAVAFWRTQPGGERFLAELERLATRTAALLPDPTPAGQDPVAYFGANYQTLGRDPLKYGFYQFRFMRDALRDRSRLDFARMVAGDGR